MQVTLIRDRVSNKSKGIAYVEFEHLDTLVDAVALSGQVCCWLEPRGGGVVLRCATEMMSLFRVFCLFVRPPLAHLSASSNPPPFVFPRHPPLPCLQELYGMPVQVQNSMAQKNRIFAGRSTATGLPSGTIPPKFDDNTPVTPVMLHIENLHASMREGDIRRLFQAFGKVNLVAMENEGENKATSGAFVEFEKGPNATLAIDAMNGYNVGNGQSMKVSICTVFPPWLQALSPTSMSFTPAGANDGNAANPGAMPGSQMPEVRTDCLQFACLSRCGNCDQHHARAHTHTHTHTHTHPRAHTHTQTHPHTHTHTHTHTHLHTLVRRSTRLRAVTGG